jgi:hypothetical protein
MAHIDWIKRKAPRLGKADPGCYAWYYRMPWVLAVAAAVVLLVYAVAVSEVIGFLCRGLVGARAMPAWDAPTILLRKVTRNRTRHLERTRSASAADPT